MKNIGKVRAFLTEFVLVILFFSLSAVIALQLFLKANDKSELSKNMTMAYIVAEQTAEAIRSEEGEVSLEELLDRKGCWYDKEWKLCDETEAKFVLSLSVVSEKTVAGVLVDIVVIVSEKAAEAVLCELPVTIYCPMTVGGEA